MSTTTSTPPTSLPKNRLLRIVSKAVAALVITLGLAGLLLVLAGVFHSKVPGKSPPRQVRHVDGLDTELVRLDRRPRYETAVGTVRPVHESAVASKLLAKVVEVNVKAGQPVARDEILVRLDDAELHARAKQAEAALVAARSAYNQADADFKRAQKLLDRKVIAQADYDRYEAAYRTADAEVRRAEESVREAKVLLDYATIRAPISGIVIDKRVEVGDTVMPGQVLLTLYDPTRMQMVVTVRESLAQRLKVGQTIRGRLESLNYECEATVSEIVPEAQMASRSFTVKVTGPCPVGVYSGMFGRILIQLDDEEVVVVPAAATIKVGQLDMVDVVEHGEVRRRSVQLGRKLGQDYEVLSGLAPGEKVVLYKGQEAGQ